MKAGGTPGGMKAVTGVTFWEGSADRFVIFDSCHTCCHKNATGRTAHFVPVL